MKSAYITRTQNAHGRSEEQQWARIFANGDPVRGMLVVFLQKMCAAYHEFEPAYRTGGLNEAALPFFRQRLSARVGVVLTALDNNGLHELPGYAVLACTNCPVTPCWPACTVPPRQPPHWAIWPTWPNPSTWPTTPSPTRWSCRSG